MLLRDLLIFAIIPAYFLTIKLLIEARKKHLFIIRRILQHLISLTIRLLGYRAAKRIWGWRTLWIEAPE